MQFMILMSEQWLNDSFSWRCSQWTLTALKRYHWLIACWFICSVNYMNMIALSVMDWNMLTRRPFWAMEQPFFSEIIFPFAIHSCSHPHLMYFSNYTEQVSKQNEKREKSNKDLGGSQLLFFQILQFALGP